MAFENDNHMRSDSHDLGTNMNTSPRDMEAPVGAPEHSMGVSSEAVDDVLYSEIGINVLLTRLKQSLASARDFANFLKKRSTLEEEHAQGLKKIAKSTHEGIRTQETRQGSYALQFADVTRAHERMAEHGMQFALSLKQMHDDLNDLCTSTERGRKHWKQEGAASEKKVKDAESLMEKARSRYNSLAEEYDRARTGDKSSGRVFTVKGPKSAEQHEMDLYKKVQNADADYASKVQVAQSQRQENLSTNRPQAVKAIQELIFECDSALLLQLQKFATFNEKLLVSNGLVVSPVKNEAMDGTSPSMREMVHQIDNGRDFQLFVTSQTSQLPPRPAEIKYEKNPILAPQPASPPAPRQPRSQQEVPAQSVRQTSQAPSLVTTQQQQHDQPWTSQQPNMSPSSSSPNYQTQKALASRSPEREFNSQSPRQYPSASPNGPYPPSVASSHVSRPSQQYGSQIPNGYPREQPFVQPVNPVFGVSLEMLFQRDETAVPLVVYQCIQAVDLFGLQMEGIYRLSGNVNHINQLKAVFDRDARNVDFRNPENFHHDVNSVAGLLKQFFRDLPDPLLTTEHYAELMDAARIEDEVVRRDSLHAIINSLPDPNYATLRALILHLHRVQEHAQTNRMSTQNLAICFGPTIMAPTRGSHMADSTLQARVVDTILQNTYQIFDED